MLASNLSSFIHVHFHVVFSFERECNGRHNYPSSDVASFSYTFIIILFLSSFLSYSLTSLVENRGQVPAACEMAFLERVKWLELYGADLHPVLVCILFILKRHAISVV